MAWNFRTIRHVDNDVEWLAIHEVFYDEEMNPNSCTQNPVTIVGENEKEVGWQIEKMKKALDKPVIEYKYFTDMEKE